MSYQNTFRAPKVANPQIAKAFSEIERQFNLIMRFMGLPSSGGSGGSILSGSGAPAAETGSDGDYYIDTTAWEIYGPKATTWPAGVSIVGPQGPAGLDGEDGTDGTDGADGKTILSGAGVPDVGLGVDGDFYINTLAWTVYGPKASGSWGSPTSIVGPQGPAGADGADGADGYTPVKGVDYFDGDDGADGTDGKTILNGSGAPGSELGVDGDYYLDTSATRLYGPKTSGAWGSGVLLIGPAGADGDDGADGADGKTILNGSGAPSSGIGADGDFYLDTAASTLYGPKTSGAWGTGVSLIGPQGAKGDKGDTGDTGPAGPAFTHKFRAYKTGDVTTHSNGWNKVNLASETYDPESIFDTSNKKATITDAGYYNIIGSISVYNNSGSTTNFAGAVYKNGSVLFEFGRTAGFSNARRNQVSGSDIQYLAANDYLELYVYFAAGTNMQLDGGEALTFLAAHRIS